MAESPNRHAMEGDSDLPAVWGPGPDCSVARLESGMLHSGAQRAMTAAWHGQRGGKTERSIACLATESKDMLSL